MSRIETQDERRERVLDRALGRAFPPPQLSKDFRRRLEAALARVGETDLSELRVRYERERHTQLAELEARYVRLRRRTLGAMMGAAFAAGAAVTLALPWLQRHVGARAPLVLASTGATIALAIAFQAWRAHARGDTV